jgi:hypothetical protein
MKKIDLLTSNHTEFLKFLKSQFPLYHKSNVFFRDLQYGVIEYFASVKKMKVPYAEADGIARQLADNLEKKEVLKKLDHQTWVLQYPEFTKKAS